MATYSHKTIALLGILLLTACSTQTPDHTHELKTDQNTIHISAVGDIMLGGTAEPELENLGYDYPFKKVSHLFKNSNIVIGNLEGPLTEHDISGNDKEYLFKSPPQRVAPALKKAGFNVMNLANNHILDYGLMGMTDTIEALKNQHIHTVGTANNLNEARRGLILASNQHKIAFLSYSLTFPESFWATEDQPGTAFGHEHQIREDVRRMKSQSDLIVVSFHWGQEKSAQLRDYQPVLAHAAIDEGADMVIGHHPHVLQAVERYKHGIILYSLGNFTFGSYSRNADISVVATATFKNKQFNSLTLTPINVLNVDVNFQPRVLYGQAADEAIERIQLLSEQRNTRIENRLGRGIVTNPVIQLNSAAFTR